MSEGYLYCEELLNWMRRGLSFWKRILMMFTKSMKLTCSKQRNVQISVTAPEPGRKQDYYCLLIIITQAARCAPNSEIKVDTSGSVWDKTKWSMCNRAFTNIDFEENDRHSRQSTYCYGHNNGALDDPPKQGLLIDVPTSASRKPNTGYYHCIWSTADKNLEYQYKLCVFKIKPRSDPQRNEDEGDSW